MGWSAQRHHVYASKDKDFIGNNGLVWERQHKFITPKYTIQIKFSVPEIY